LPYVESAELLQSPFRAIDVRVNGDGTVKLMWKRVQTADLVASVHGLEDVSNPRWAIVSVGSRVPYGSVKAVLSKLADAGVSRITLRTSKFRPSAGQR
jgi:biopolymer transport protein ExbD